MEKLAGIILMAGLSTRFEGPENKQLSLLNGKPVFTYSIDTFGKRKFDELVIAVNKDNKETIENYLKNAGISTKIVLGGDTRQGSVRNALSALKLAENDIVVIHDAARPLVDTFIINQVVKAAEGKGASTAYLESTNTLAIKNENNEVIEFVDRKTIAQIQTPQAFRYGLLKKAHESAKDAEATDDCSLVMGFGGKIALVKGDKKYHKITTKEDILYLEALLRGWRNIKLARL